METVNNARKRNSILIKGCFVLLVALVLQIPILMVRGLVNDRKKLSNEVKSELTTSFGGDMEVTTPQLHVTYTDTAVQKSEPLVRRIKSSEVQVEANVDSQIRHRSIYDIPVYTADMTVKGKIELDEKSLESCEGAIMLTLPFSKYKGIEGRPVVVVDGKEYAVVIPGDVDCDGAISAADARLALRTSVGLEKYSEISPEYKAANIERADGITASDARLILRASVGLEDTKAWIQ